MWPCVASWDGVESRNSWGNMARHPRWDCSLLRSVCTASTGKCNLVLSEQWAKDFHEYSFVWTETALDFFLDGVHINHIAMSHLDAHARPTNPWSFPLPAFMRLNLATPKNTDWNTARWPILLEVDYVRYYGMPPAPAAPPSRPPPDPPPPPRPPSSPPQRPDPPTPLPTMPPLPMPPAQPLPLLPVPLTAAVAVLITLLVVALGGGVLMAGWRWYCQGGNRDSKQILLSSAPSQDDGDRSRSSSE